MKNLRAMPVTGMLVLACLWVSSVSAVRAAEVGLSLSAAQIAALGIETRTLQSTHGGEMQGLAAQVVVPSAQQRVVSAPLAGLVEQVLVATQQPVRKGQLLVRIQSPALAEAQKGYLQALTQWDLAKTRLDRDERLFREGIIAESRVQATRSQWAEASAAQAERVQALRMAGLDDQAMRRLREGRRQDAIVELRSPMDGVVVEQMVVIGQRLEAATALLRIARTDPLWIEVQVPASRLAGVREGAMVRAPGGVQARVIAVSRNIHPGTQTALVRAQTLPGGVGLMPGQSIEVSLATMTTTAGGGAQWRVPNAALLRQGAELGVFVRTAKGFRLVPVKRVTEDNDTSLVEGALSTGDAVAVKGLVALKSALAGTGAP